MTKKTKQSNTDIQKTLHFVPLGGSDEFGLNFNVYEYDGRYLIFDCGMGFADASLPNVDILLPDTRWLDDKTDLIDGLIITHAHEDHIGALPHLWPRLQCPIYCTDFTATVLRAKIQEFPECHEMKIHIVKTGLDQKPLKFHHRFELQFIHVTHSIPGAFMSILKTPVGTVVHSGDWNLDDRPVIGLPTDTKSITQLGQDEQILAYVGDSTNSGVSGRSGSETDVAAGLLETFSRCENAIAVTIFSSNISRFYSIYKAAKAVGRKVAVFGYSMNRMIGCAQECGILPRDLELMSAKDAKKLGRDQIVYVLTGSQGESNAALARVSRADHPDIRLQRGDHVIFSARAIPSNIREILDLKNRLVQSGIDVIDPRNAPALIHVSGHPCEDEILDMIAMLKPKILIAVHGERAQIEDQCNLALSRGHVTQAIAARNGEVIAISSDHAAEVINHVDTGVLAVEPNRVLSVSSTILKKRSKLQFTGVTVVTVTMDDTGQLMTDSRLSCVGLFDPADPLDCELEKELLDTIETTLEDIKQIDRTNHSLVESKIKIAIKRYMNDMLGLKPTIIVHIMVV
jgi:ribonuclease J